MSFAERYGPWALVAGASDGVGAEFAHEIARRGVNVVLLARRQRVLDEVAASIARESRVETRAVAVDLAASDAIERVRAATTGLDVGFLVYCAGADPDYEPFLAGGVERATAMVARGRGGIVILGSAAGFAGAPNMVAYAASKAFDMVMAEALWAELHEQGVDVLGLILGLTDTPALRRLRASLGHDDAPDAALAGAATPQEVVREAFENLASGPLPRGEAVKLMIQASAATMGAQRR